MTFKSFFQRHHDDPKLTAAPPHPPIPLHPKICYATASAGQHPTAYTLLAKIQAIAEAGIDLIEVAWQDLEAMAGVGKGKGEEDEEIEKIVSAAEEVRRNCEEKGVKILVLMPCVGFSCRLFGQEYLQLPTIRFACLGSRNLRVMKTKRSERRVFSERGSGSKL
jgi:hypothetical protein